MLRGALGGYDLASVPTPVRAAADAVFKTRDASAAAASGEGIRPRDGRRRPRPHGRALAAMRAGSAERPSSVIAAMRALAGFPDPEVAFAAGERRRRRSDAGVRAAAAAALERVEQRWRCGASLGNVFQGVSLGSVLLLAAVGLAITFGVMGVINMAHGEMVMLGAYTTFVVQDLFRTYAAGRFDFSVLVAIPAAFVFAGLVGIAIERGIIRFLYGRPLETLLATWGLSLILQQAVRTIFGPSNREVGNPSWMSGSLELVGGLTLTYNRIWIIVFSLLVFAALLLLIRGTASACRCAR